MKKEKPDWAQRIYRDQSRVFGKLLIRDTGIAPSTVLDYLAEGMTAREIIERHPELDEIDIRNCIAFAAYHVRQSSGWPWVILALMIPGC